MLVVLSSKAMVFDHEALRQKVVLAYPDAAVFFVTTAGNPLGIPAPRRVDLLIDFTGPGQRQPLSVLMRIKRSARIAVGRDAGFLRKRMYDRVFNEKHVTLPVDLLERERAAQLAVLELAGIPSAQSGEGVPDQAHSIALELPSMPQL